MIKINNKIYETYDSKVTFGKFECVFKGEKMAGLSPFITFCIDKDIYIGLETIISDKKINSLKINDKYNIKDYFTDIAYEDENGWVSIIDGKYDCNITRITDDKFLLEFYVKDDFEDLEITISETLNLKDY